MNSNENTQDNIPSTNQLLSRQQLEMGTSVAEKKLEEARSNSHQMVVNDQSSVKINNNNTTDMIGSRGNMQSTTTDNVFSNGQNMNMYDYSCLLLEKLIDIVDDFKPALIALSAEGADRLLKDLEIPLSQHKKMIFKEPLETFADILQVSFAILNQLNSENNADFIGEESNETAEQRISAPDENNDNHLNKQLQASTQLNLMPPVLQEIGSTSSSLSLTELLLLQAREQLKQLELVKLEVNKQPQKFWKKRYISCLCGKSCPYIQSDSRIQKEYPLIKWSKLTNENLSNLFMLVELLSYNNERHPTKIIIPPETTLKQAKVVAGKRKRSKVRCTLDDLVIDEMYGFDKKSQRILYHMTEGECCQCEKELMVKVIGLYTISENQETDDEEPTDGQEEKDDEEPTDGEKEKDISIQNELNKLFKFRICLCRRPGNGQLERISNFIDTQWVEESKGNKSLAIDRSKVTPQYLCDCGNETITVPLNTDSEKDGFVVRLNGDELKAAEIRGVKDKQISFKSRPNRKAGQNYLHVKVSKESALKTIMENHDPYKGLDENELLNMKIYYVQCSDNAHEHRFPVQSNEMIEESE